MKYYNAVIIITTCTVLNRTTNLEISSISRFGGKLTLNKRNTMCDKNVLSSKIIQNKTQSVVILLTLSVKICSKSAKMNDSRYKFVQMELINIWPRNTEMQYFQL